jgi:hypothetical protein
MGMDRMPDETRAQREMVDALRESLGLDPLYGTGSTDQRTWLDDVTCAYQGARHGRVIPKVGQ